MRKPIYIRDEFLEKVGINSGELAKWEQLKLITPSGFTDDKIPCYSDDTIAMVRHIQKLQELGYASEEINKIVRKVGLPNQPTQKPDDKNASKYLTVGHLAEQVGVSPRTIKHWETKGIIEADMRSAGGFRLYSDHYIYLCKLLIDLQLFGYSLDEIKQVSDYFREFLSIKEHIGDLDTVSTKERLDFLINEITALFEKVEKLKSGVQRWEDLIKKKKKEIVGLKNQLEKREKEAEKKTEKGKNNKSKGPQMTRIKNK